MIYWIFSYIHLQSPVIITLDKARLLAAAFHKEILITRGGQNNTISQILMFIRFCSLIKIYRATARGSSEKKEFRDRARGIDWNKNNTSLGLQALFFLFGWLNTRIDSEDKAGS